MSGENTGSIDSPMFAAYSGDTMDKVADIMGMYRKPGERDEELRARVIDKFRQLDSFDPGYPPDLFPFKSLRIELPNTE